MVRVEGCVVSCFLCWRRRRWWLFSFFYSFFFEFKFPYSSISIDSVVSVVEKAGGKEIKKESESFCSGWTTVVEEREVRSFHVLSTVSCLNNNVK